MNKITWAAPALGVVLALALVSQCNGRRRAEAALQAERTAAAERERLLQEGLEVVVQAPTVEPQVKDLEKSDPEIKAVSVRAKKAAPTLQPTAVVRASTGRVRVAGKDPCLLRPGDDIEIKVNEVVLTSKAGTSVLVGTASAYHDALRLGGGSFNVPLTDATAKARPGPEAARWGAGPVLGVGRHGALVGGTVVSPEGKLPLLGWKVTATATVAVGTGEVVGLAGLLFRP